MAENPIPGNPDALRDLARRLRGGWSTLRNLREMMTAFQNDQAWKGEAANEFRSVAGGLPVKVGHAEARFWRTSQALIPYAEDLEEAQRLAGPAQQALEAARGDLRSATGHREQVRISIVQRLPGSPEPNGPEWAEAERSIGSAQDAIIAAEKRLGKAIGLVKESAGRCATAIAAAIDDPLMDENSWLAGAKRIARGMGDTVADNPWLGAFSLPFAALGLGSGEGGRNILELTSDGLNLIALGLGVAGLFFPSLEIAAFAAGGLGLVLDGALYAHGRKDETDLGLDVLGTATFGIGRVFGGLSKSASGLPQAGRAAVRAFDEASASFADEAADVASVGRRIGDAAARAETAVARVGTMSLESSGMP